MSGNLASLLVVPLLVFVALHLSTTVKGDEDEYIQSLEEAYNSTGIPWDEILYKDDLETLSASIDFPCDTNLEGKATNVNELTPADIKVVGALGDSITAAMGAEANCIFKALREYRGVSWSIGGDGDLASYLTLPNIIKKYNPNVKGFSIKYGNSKSSNARNNVARSGAKAVAMPTQARTLVDKIKGDSSVDYENDWKLVTLWIGGNDLCAVCKGNSDQFPENYGQYIADALRILKEMPRTLVNVVKILDVTRLNPVTDEGGFLCKVVHKVVCDCAKDKSTSETQRLYNEQLETIVNNEEFHTDDFTVVLQPFMEEVSAPTKDDGTVDKSYFAIDCFHFRTKGHRVAAAALWNNMMEPVGTKSNNIDWDVDVTLKCPLEGAPYIFTKKNSQAYSSFGAVPSGDLQGDGQTAPVNLLAVLLGTGAALLVVVVVMVGGVVGALWHKRRQRRGRNLTRGTVVCDNERVYLVTKN